MVVPAGFAVTVVVEGAGTVTTDASRGNTESHSPRKYIDPGQEEGARGGETMPIRSGDVLLVPDAAGPIRVDGDVTLIRCLPPVPAQASPNPTDQSSGPRVAQPSTNTTPV